MTDQPSRPAPSGIVRSTGSTARQAPASCVAAKLAGNVKTAALLLLPALLAASEPNNAPHKSVEPRLPKLTSVFPQGAQPAAKLRVEVLGEFVDRAQAVVFLDPAIHAAIAESAYTRLALDF